MEIPSDFPFFLSPLSSSLSPPIWGVHLSFHTIVFIVGIVESKKMSGKSEMCQRSLLFALIPPPEHRASRWKQAVLCEHFDIVLSVSDKNLLLWQVDRVSPRAPDSNTTKSGPVRRQFTPSRRTAGHILEAREIIVRGELSGIRSVTMWTIISQSPLTSPSVEENCLPRDWILQCRSGFLEQLAAQLYKYYLCPNIYLQKNI